VQQHVNDRLVPFPYCTHYLKLGKYGIQQLRKAILVHMDGAPALFDHNGASVPGECFSHPPCCFCMAFPSWNRAWTAAAARGTPPRSAHKASARPRNGTSCRRPARRRPTVSGVLVGHRHGVTRTLAETRRDSVCAPRIPCSDTARGPATTTFGYLS
jgi:hypothetical protein